MPNGKVRNFSSRVLWVVRKDDGPAIAYRLQPGNESPPGVDADGFRAVDGTPVDGHTDWVKIIDLATADVKDDGTGHLTRGCLLCADVASTEFGEVTFNEAKTGGGPLTKPESKKDPHDCSGASGLVLGSC